MALNFKIANASASASADAVCPLLNGGTLKIYDGAQPADADTAVGAQNLLATLSFGNPAFGAASNGVATANAITPGTGLYNPSGTAAWFRALTSGAAKVFDGTVGLSGCDLNLNALLIAYGATVTVTSMTYTQPKA